MSEANSTMTLAQAARIAGRQYTALRTWVEVGWLRTIQDDPMLVTYGDLCEAITTARWAPRQDPGAHVLEHPEGTNYPPHVRHGRTAMVHALGLCVALQRNATP